MVRKKRTLGKETLLKSVDTRVDANEAQVKAERRILWFMVRA